MDDILLADDDLSIRKSYTAYLEDNGFTVRVARNGEEALMLYRDKKPELTLLDVMMPKMNGISVCEEIRKVDRMTPILFFTAMPSDVSQVLGLGLGADDYIDKADGPDIVLARIQRALARVKSFTEAFSASRRKVALGPVEVDFDALSVTDPNGTRRLTKTEADILFILCSDRGRFFSRDEVAEIVRGTDYTDELLCTHVSRLRKKLGQATDLLVSERGVGYKLLP